MVHFASSWRKTSYVGIVFAVHTTVVRCTYQTNLLITGFGPYLLALRERRTLVSRTNIKETSSSSS